MNAKHTPGPWRIGTPPPNGQQTIGTDQGLMVAVATTGAGVQTKANAHLIAAAPDLLEALQALMDDNSALDGMYWADCCDKARAAIAKATGEPQ